ncbi:tail fiber protein [Brevibacillus choshinensis]|uniref:phage tail protein n=1 Tax=Brevibacillus choshinensis TaxID=54911 RepID=UPI002E1F62C4|nr:tail fiber protein [Brevibacillus choshinensis]
MSEPFIGEIRLFALNFEPRGWAFCNGQIMAINTNQALFSLLGTTYGGNGVTTFALPDLRGRVPVNAGNSVTLGQSAGEEAHTLTLQEMPTHTHSVSASSEKANEVSPGGKVWAVKENSYAKVESPDYVMSSQALSSAGGNQAHTNMQPYLVMNFCIALQGVFPSRN